MRKNTIFDSLQMTGRVLANSFAILKRIAVPVFILVAFMFFLSELEDLLLV